MASDATERLDAEHPWPGLLAFTEAGRSFFHGRTAEVAHLLRLLRRQRLTILYGRSGLGKTSLLKAGLFPRLREEQFLPIYIRLALQDGAVSPIEQVQNELAAQLHDGGVHVRRCAANESLWEYFHEIDTEFWDRRNRLVVPVLVFDQFEEIFTVGQNQPGLRVCLDQLADLVANRMPAKLEMALGDEPRRERRFDFVGMDFKVVLSFREDYLAEFDNLPRPITSIGEERMRLTAMTGRQAKEAILQAGSVLVVESVATKIIAFVAGRAASDVDTSAELAEVEIDPALLSLFCWQLNKRRIARGQAQITDDLLAGEKDQIIAEFYRDAVADVANITRLFIEEELITSAGYRDSRALDDAVVQGVPRSDID